MSPRKSRRGAKVESADESLLETDVSKVPETPDTSRRILRTRRQLKQKNSSDSDAEQSPQLNDSRRPTRRGRAKKIIDDSINSSVTVTSARKRNRKDKDTRALVEETVVVENDNGIQESTSVQKTKVNRGRKKAASKKADDTISINDDAECLPSDQNNIHNDSSKYSMIQKDDQAVGNSNALNEDDEVASMSKKAATGKFGKTPSVHRFLQPRSCNINSPNVIVTPECSPLTVNLTPHRATKTPRKSPINIGSPKTHSLSPQRLSKTPRKLPVTSDSPVPSNQSPTNATSHNNVFDAAGNKLQLNSSGDESFGRSTRSATKSPKIVVRTSKPKSPRTISTKIKKSPIPKRNSQLSENSSPKKGNNTAIQNMERVTKSPLLVLDRIPPSLSISPSAENLITPVISPNTWKKSMNGVESPKRQKSMGKRRSPITECGTPLRPIPTPKPADETKEESEKSRIISSNSTPAAPSGTETKLAMTSSTPRERIRRSLNLSPGFSASPSISRAPMPVKTFYGASLKVSMPNISIDKSIRIEDESNVLFTDDDLSFNISGVKAVDSSQNDDEATVTPEKKNKKTNDTYELEEPATPGLNKQNKTANDTYELDEPKTPGLRKRRSLVETNSNVLENTDDQISTKRVCRVRFASPPLNSPSKVVSKDRIFSRSSTPANKGSRKRTLNHVTDTSINDSKPVKDTIFPRRSNSLTNLSVATPSKINIKKRSASVVDVGSKSAQKNLQNLSVNRLSRPKLPTTSDKKPEVKSMSARKAPNFAQIHQKKFARMESLVDAKKRVEERHNALTNNATVPTSTSKPTPNSVLQNKAVKASPSDVTNGAFNRFGYRVRKEDATKIVKKQPTLKRSEEKKVEKRMALKGVRTNRRFELQMKMRNINP